MSLSALFLFSSAFLDRAVALKLRPQWPLLPLLEPTQESLSWELGSLARCYGDYCVHWRAEWTWRCGTRRRRLEVVLPHRVSAKAHRPISECSMFFIVHYYQIVVLICNETEYVALFHICADLVQNGWCLFSPSVDGRAPLLFSVYTEPRL